MSRIIIVDPDFEHDGGHNLTANSTIASRGLGEVMIVAPVTLSMQVQVSGAAIRRIFPCNSYLATNPRSTFQDRLGGLARLILPGMHHAAESSPALHYRKVLRDFWEDIEIGSNDSVVVHTGSEVLLAALLDTIEALPLVRQPVLHFRQVRPLSSTEAARDSFARLAHRVRQNQAFIYNETEAFKAMLVSLGIDESRIDRLELVDCSRAHRKQRPPDGFVNVAVLGTVRLEKGYARLAVIAREYQQIAAGFRGPQLRYLIHAAHVKNRKLFDRMQKSLDAANIAYELADVGPGDIVHWRCVADCHVVLMPYQATQYHCRGSGVAIDAILSARPVLITGGCTLEEYVRDQNGLVASSDRDFAHALWEIVRKYDGYSQRAADLALRVRAAQDNHPLYARLGQTNNNRQAGKVG